ncbi:TPA: YeaC family protein [Providencia rettgeri]
MSVEVNPEQLEQLLAVMTPEIYERLVTAVELGKWPDGVALTDEQKEHSLQMVMLWQSRHNHDPEHMTVGTNGEITMKSKQELKTQFQGEMLATLKPQNNDE